MYHKSVLRNILIFAIVCLTAALLYFQHVSPVSEGFDASQETTASPIPRKIWSFWDNPDTIPDVVQLCMKSWKKHNPDYEVQLLTKANYKDFVDIPDHIRDHPNMNDSHQRFSDLIRLYALAEHGGVWIDSSSLVGEPFSNWIKEPTKDLYGFSIIYGGYTRPYPIIESWFFAAPKNSPFVQQWRDEFSQLSQFGSVKEYVDSRREMGVDLKDWSTSPEYLAIHVAAQKLLQMDKYSLDKLQLWPAEKGPFRYVVENGWDPKKGIQAACADPSYRKPFMKMRSNERHAMESEIATNFSNEKCHWV